VTELKQSMQPGKGRKPPLTGFGLLSLNSPPSDFPAGGFSVFAGVGERTREGNDLYREMIESGELTWYCCAAGTAGMAPLVWSSWYGTVCTCMHPPAPLCLLAERQVGQPGVHLRMPAPPRLWQPSLLPASAVPPPSLTQLPRCLRLPCAPTSLLSAPAPRQALSSLATSRPTPR